MELVPLRKKLERAEKSAAMTVTLARFDVISPTTRAYFFTNAPLAINKETGMPDIRFILHAPPGAYKPDVVYSVYLKLNRDVT